MEASGVWPGPEPLGPDAGLRRHPARGRRAAEALAPGPDRRARGPVLPRPWPGTRRPRPARPGPPGVPHLGRDRQGRPAGLGLPGPAATYRPGRHRRRAVRRSHRPPCRRHGRNGRPARDPFGVAGATGVRLLLWDSDRQDWLLPAPGGGAIPVSGTGQESAAPMSVLRYVQRTSEPLAVGDATGDDRFARDPYFAGVDCCSLLAVPILSRGALRAVLLLENRLLGGAFTAGRMDAVKLIAGQLAVSLDNAQLYAESRQIGQRGQARASVRRAGRARRG